MELVSSNGSAGTGNTLATAKNPEGLTPFERVVDFVQPSRGPPVKPAAAAAAASGQLDRRLVPASKTIAALGCAIMMVPVVVSYLWLCWSLARREQAHEWSYRSSSSQNEIPRIIHQMYRSWELPEPWKATSRAWVSAHTDYSYVLWTDEMLRQLIADDYPWLLETYDSYPHDTQRWDASRYAILHKHGGVYVDLDIGPVERIDPLLQGQRLLLPHTPNIGLTNALMASVAEHPFMDEALRLLPKYAHAWYHLSKHNTVLSSTGSTYVWALFMRWPHDRIDQPALIKARTWGKCSICWSPMTMHGPDLPNGRPLFQHSRGSSWHSADSVLFLYIFCHLELCFAVSLGILVYLRLRSPARACLVAGGTVGLCWLVPVLGIHWFETFLARPWIWLIMVYGK